MSLPNKKMDKVVSCLPCIPYVQFFCAPYRKAGDVMSWSGRSRYGCVFNWIRNILLPMYLGSGQYWGLFNASRQCADIDTWSTTLIIFRPFIAHTKSLGTNNIIKYIVHLSKSRERPSRSEALSELPAILGPERGKPKTKYIHIHHNHRQTQ